MCNSLLRYYTCSGLIYVHVVLLVLVPSPHVAQFQRKLHYLLNIPTWIYHTGHYLLLLSLITYSPYCASLQKMYAYVCYRTKSGSFPLNGNSPEVIPKVNLSISP